MSLDDAIERQERAREAFDAQAQHRSREREALVASRRQLIADFLGRVQERGLEAVRFVTYKEHGAGILGLLFALADDERESRIERFPYDGGKSRIHTGTRYTGLFGYGPLKFDHLEYTGEEYLAVVTDGTLRRVGGGGKHLSDMGPMDWELLDSRAVKQLADSMARYLANNRTARDVTG